MSSLVDEVRFALLFRKLLISIIYDIIVLRFLDR
jgi:hypothetical protein